VVRPVRDAELVIAKACRSGTAWMAGTPPDHGPDHGPGAAMTAIVLVEERQRFLRAWHEHFR
jgi:hypothetical protein